jgi:DNA-binding XRE family transcriptional regulator
MARHDGYGRNLKAVLGYIINRTVTDNEICSAIGINRNTYYARRREADDYPNAEECRLIAEHFRLNPVDLMVMFGLLDAEEVARYAEQYLAGKRANALGMPPPMTMTTPTVSQIASNDGQYADDDATDGKRRTVKGYPQ